MRTVLVTGANGLIGSEVCRKLLEEKNKVIALDREFSQLSKVKSDLLTFVTLDMISADLEKTLDKYLPDSVIHCAAHPGGKSLSEPVKDVEVNSLASMKLFYWCALKKVEVIYLSSSAVYGPEHSNGPLKESDKLNPGTIYAVCKVACENYLKILGEGYGLKWTVLRLFATYGNGHQANTFQGIVNVLLTQLERGQKVEVKGSLDRIRGLIYVSDAAKGIVQALHSSEARGHIINLSHPEPATVGEILNKLIEIKDKKDVEIIVSEGTVGDPMFNYADCSKASKFFNFQPEYSLDQGLKELVKQRLETL